VLAKVEAVVAREADDLRAVPYGETGIKQVRRVERLLIAERRLVALRRGFEAAAGNSAVHIVEHRGERVPARAPDHVLRLGLDGAREKLKDLEDELARLVV
jgi:hypothetical protein